MQELKKPLGTYGAQNPTDNQKHEKTRARKLKDEHKDRPNGNVHVYDLDWRRGRRQRTNKRREAARL